jgi:hypothetical protein
MDVESDGIPAEEMTRDYDDSSDSDSSDGAVPAVSRGGARLDSAGNAYQGGRPLRTRFKRERMFLKAREGCALASFTRRCV